LLDLERCSFIRALDVAADDLGPSEKLGCWASGQGQQVTVATQRTRCFTAGHTKCPALLEALAGAPSGPWSDLAASLQIVAEACRLTIARQEVNAERLDPALERLFGDRG
jgi:hypothetical protein